MGTNYYVRTPGCENACKHGCPESKLIHLGKSSAGWRFLFRAYPEWPRELAYARWLGLAEAGSIEDEYGMPVVLEDLLAWVRARQGDRRHLAAVSAAYFTCDGSDFCDVDFC